MNGIELSRYPEKWPKTRLLDHYARPAWLSLRVGNIATRNCHETLLPEDLIGDPKQE
jgi:hypothetical protein